MLLPEQKLIMPDFFSPSERILQLTNGYTAPFTRLDFKFKYPNLDDFVAVMKGMIASGKIYEYENYDYVQGSRHTNNLTECKSIYVKSGNGYEYARIERLETGQNINFTLYNKNVGWFPEVKEAFPDLVEMCDRFIKEYKVDTWKIVIGRMLTDLGWHMDIDGYYGFRFHLSDNPFELAFREIKPECVEDVRRKAWTGQWKQVDETVNETTYETEYLVHREDGQSFIFNGMNYVHHLSNNKPQFFLFIKGTV
jgi:hypothetical protein